jgi:hypothetical protein
VFQAQPKWEIPVKGVDGDTFDELTDIKNSQTKAIQ